MYEADRLRLFTVDLPCVDETWNLMRRDMHLGPAFPLFRETLFPKPPGAQADEAI